MDTFAILIIYLKYHIMCLKNIIALLLFCTIYANAEEKSAKVAFIGKRIVNVGEVKKGDPVKQVITFKNVGNAPLLISDIGKSCTCTSASVSKKELQPGETADITVEVDTSKKMGVYRATVSFSTNIKPKNYIIVVIMNVK